MTEIQYAIFDDIIHQRKIEDITNTLCQLMKETSFKHVIVLSREQYMSLRKTVLSDTFIQQHQVLLYDVRSVSVILFFSSDEAFLPVEKAILTGEGGI